MCVQFSRKTLLPTLFSTRMKVSSPHPYLSSSWSLFVVWCFKCYDHPAMIFPVKEFVANVILSFEIQENATEEEEKTMKGRWKVVKIDQTNRTVSTMI